MNAILVSFIFYLLIVVVVGILTFRFMRSLSDFLLGGRRLGPLVVAISERASGESAWFLLGLPGLAYVSGCSAFWPVIGCAVGIFASWTLISKRLRIHSERLGALTIPDYLESKFGDETHILRIVSMVIIIFFYTFYVGAQFIGAGKVLNATFGLNQTTGMALGAAVIVFYTLMGGFLAVAWTDLFQGLLMAFVSVLLPLIGIIKLGGWGGFTSAIENIEPLFLNIGGGKIGKELILGLAIGGLGIGLGYMGQPHLMVRYMAIRKTRELRQGTLIAMIWVLLAYWGAVFIGLVGLGIMGQSISDPEQVMPLLTKVLLPGWLAGIIISGAIAAMMSTADSQLLVATSAVAEDVYHKLMNRDAPQKKLVLISRISTIVIGGVAFVLAITAKQFIYWLVLYAWAGLGASFGPTIILSLWWKKVTKWGAFAGLISGTATVIIWYNVPALKGFIYELVPGFMVSFLSVLIVSILTGKK